MFSLSIFICVFKARCDFDSISCTKEKHSVMFFFQRIFLLWFFQSSLRVFFINESYRTIEIKICHYISNVLIASTVKLPNNLNPITITFFISKDLNFLPKWLYSIWLKWNCFQFELNSVRGGTRTFHTLLLKKMMCLFDEAIEPQWMVFCKGGSLVKFSHPLKYF